MLIASVVYLSALQYLSVLKRAQLIQVLKFVTRLDYNFVGFWARIIQFQITAVHPVANWRISLFSHLMYDLFAAIYPFFLEYLVSSPHTYNFVLFSFSYTLHFCKKAKQIITIRHEKWLNWVRWFHCNYLASNSLAEKTFPFRYIWFNHYKHGFLSYIPILVTVKHI